MNMNFVTSAVKDTPLERSSQANMRISKMWCFYILLLHLQYVQVLILQGYIYLITVFTSLVLKKSQPQTGWVRFPLMTEMVSELSTESHAKGSGTTRMVTVLQPLAPFFREASRLQAPASVCAPGRQ